MSSSESPDGRRPYARDSGEFVEEIAPRATAFAEMATLRRQMPKCMSDEALRELQLYLLRCRHPDRPAGHPLEFVEDVPPESGSWTDSDGVLVYGVTWFDSGLDSHPLT